MHSIGIVLLGVLLASAALVLRTAVHLGRAPGGVDTWYFLAYADGVRRSPGLAVRLPQYMLQDEEQSYPPLFPHLLALLPEQWLLRYYWTLSPLVDCCHLLLLYGLTLRTTGSLAIAGIAGTVYATTPHLVAETRTLNPRGLAALLHTLAVLGALRFVAFGGGWPWLVLAIVLGATLILASATGSAAYAFVSAVYCIAYCNLRYGLVVMGALSLAFLLSRGRLLSIVLNYVSALQYWRRNRHNFGAHPILDSPVYGTPRAHGSGAWHPGFLGGSTPQMFARLLGENPFWLVLFLAPPGLDPLGTRARAWALSLTVLAVAATLIAPLRAFGPGRGLFKAAVFPTAYCLAVSMGGGRGFTTLVGLATVGAVALSLAAIVFFWYHVRRQATEQTASVPSGLGAAVRHLATLPGDGVLCLPYMYSDFVCYHSRKRILWGGHCGDLHRFEEVAPVLTRALPELFEAYGVRYLLLDHLYASLTDLHLDGEVRTEGCFESFEIYAWAPSAR
jgi:hypothetical protein